MLKFFKIVDGELEINKEELYLIPTARTLVEKDKGSDGDYDGRKKLMAKKKLGVVWWVVDINSPGIQAGLDGDELMEDAIASLDVPRDWEWKKDEYFIAFLEVYRNWYDSFAPIKLLKTTLRAFNDTALIVDAISKQTKKTLKDKIDLDAEDMKILVSAQNQIISISVEVPTHIKKLKELQEVVSKEEKEQTLARGDKKITSSMIPEQ